MAGKQPITLVVQEDLYVTGAVVQGYVEVNFPLLQDARIEEVHVKLRGFARTVIHDSTAAAAMNTMVNSREKIVDLVRESTSVWTRGQIFPLPGAHTLRFPFRFLLPDDLPPSFHLTAQTPKDNATVRYYVEAVGTRPGAFRMNKRATHPIAVLPVGTAGAQQLRKLMAKSDWDGEWTTTYKEAKIRKGIWGGYATVSMECRLPKLAKFPLFTCIPFSIRVVAISKRLSKGSTPETKPIWPSAPVLPKEVDFDLKHRVNIRVEGHKATFREKVASAGGMGISRSPTAVEIDTPERVWVPSSDHDETTGSWKQETTFTSTLEFKCSPSFSFETMDNEYFLHIGISFGGLFNTLSADFDITIVSAMPPPTEPPAVSLEDTMENPAYPGPPSESVVLDLPPSYWSASEWEPRDEKE